MNFTIDSISQTAISNLISLFPSFEKNILFIDQCDFRFQNTEYKNGILAMTLHFIGLFIEQSKDQFKKIAFFNILSLSNFILTKESKRKESLYLETSDFHVDIFSGNVIQISRIIFRNYTLSTLSLPKNQKISFQVYDPSLFPLFKLPFSISQIFQFRYSALCAQNEKSYDHTIVQYFHSLMKSHDPIFNLKHIPNSIDRQQILPIFQSLIYIPTIFGISCRNNDTPSIISDISSLIAQSTSIRSIKLMNCNCNSDLDIFSQAISSNKQLPLEELFLNDNEFDDLSPLINSLSNLQSQMKTLSLSDCGLDDSSLELLGNCLIESKSLQNLKYLGIGGTEFKDNHVKDIIKYIQTNTRLISLDLSGSKNFSTILKSIPGSSITDLNLSDCIFDDKSVSQLNYASQFISSLNISGCDLNFYEVSDTISKLGKKIDSLVSIKLNGLNFAKDRSFAILRGFLLTDLEKWKSIEMNDTQITSSELFAYQALFLKMSHLEHLAFNSNFKEEDAKCIASLFEIKSLRSISLANCRLASIIPNIKKSELNVVNMSSNGLNDQEALSLLSAPNLTCVKLNDNSFKNFEKIVQTANENTRLNEPPLKHGLSTIRRISPYSKDFADIISKYNVDQHTALNEDLQIPYPFTQKDHEEEILEIGDPSTYDLDKLNCVTIENNASTQQLKMVDMNPEVDLFKDPRSNSSKSQKKSNFLSNNSPETPKNNNHYDNNYSSDDQYNEEDQIQYKKDNFNEYEYGNSNQYDNNDQYENDKLYDNDNQYEEDNQYDKENQYENEDQYEKDDQYDNKDEKTNKRQISAKKLKRNDDDEILALMDSPAIEQPENKKDNKKSRASYDTSNSESIAQRNYHHNLPPPLDDDLNPGSEDSGYSKSSNGHILNVKNHIGSKNENNNQYSILEEEEEDWSIDNTEVDDANVKPPQIKFTENSSSSQSPSHKTQNTDSKENSQTKFNDNQYDEDSTDEIEQNENNNIINSNKKPQNKSSKSKYDAYDEVEDENDESYSNNMNKKRDNFIQGFRRAMFGSEDSENEEQTKNQNQDEKITPNPKRKVDFNSNSDDEEEIGINNNRKSDSITDRSQQSKLNDASQDKAEESENENQQQIINDDDENSSENEIENDDDLQNYSRNNKSHRSESKSQKSSEIQNINSNNRQSSIEKVEQNKEDENDGIDVFLLDDDESNSSQKQHQKRRRSRIPSPFELRQSSPPSRKINNDIGSDGSSSNKSKIPGPRSPQRSVANPHHQQQQEQPDNDQNDQPQNQRIPRRVLFDSDENEVGNKNRNNENSKLIDEENVINNLNLSSTEEPLIHKNANSIPDRHPSLSEEEELFRMRRMRLPRKVLNQSDESDNYNDTLSISSNSFSPQHQPPSPPLANDNQNSKRITSNKIPKKPFSNENDIENENLFSDAKTIPKTSFIIPKAPEPSTEESLSSAYDFVALTSMLFSKPKKKPHNNQISPLILAFSLPFLEEE